MTEEDSGIDRRKLLLAGGAGAATLLAGCAGEMEDEDGNETDGEDGSASYRPTLPADPSELSQPERFIVESLDYQNRLLEREFGE